MYFRTALSLLLVHVTVNTEDRTLKLRGGIPLPFMTMLPCACLTNCHTVGNPEVRQIVDGVVSEHLHTLFEWQPALFTALCNKALAAQAASVAARAAREMVRTHTVHCLFCCVRMFTERFVRDFLHYVTYRLLSYS